MVVLRTMESRSGKITYYIWHKCLDVKVVHPPRGPAEPFKFRFRWCEEHYPLPGAGKNPLPSLTPDKADIVYLEKRRAPNGFEKVFRE
jgi:hypothetical protein